MLRRGTKGLRVPGHHLTIEWNGERKSGERGSTGRCPCGWEEYCSTQAEVRNEYRFHLEDLLKKQISNG